MVQIKTGIPTLESSIPLARPWITQDDIDAVLSVLQSPTLSMGPRVRAFEDAMARYAGVREGIAVNSGTSGLHLCLAALGIGPGDEVITSPFSFVASANCILYQGATPVFADIDPVTLCIDPTQIAARITDRTKAIIPVDVFGQPSAVDEILALAEPRGIPVIFDSCEAIGAERNGDRLGSRGTASVFAFYPNKQMTTGEGGMVVTDDSELARVIRSLCNQGRDDAGTWMNHVRLGYNYRLDEMSAALGLSQLRRLDDILERRNQVAGWYGKHLAGIDGITPPIVVPETTRMSWFVYVIRVAEEIGRNALMEALAEMDIPARPYFVPIHLQPYYRDRFGFGDGDFPITESIAKSTLAIPFFTEMSEEQVEHVAHSISILVSRDREFA
jgi:perosamine synthetase